MSIEHTPHAAALVELAIRRERRGRFSEAIALLNSALEIEPRNAVAWRHLGALQKMAGRTEAAIACFRRSLAIEPDSANTLLNLGALYLVNHRAADAIEAYEEAAAVEPEDSNSHYNLGLALHEAGRTDDALSAFAKACHLDPKHANGHFMQALLLLLQGRFDEGWRKYQWRWSLEAAGRRPTDLAEWQGENFEGKSLVVVPEQGHGDTIWTSRFLPEVKQRGGSVILQTRPETRVLLSKLPGVDIFIDIGDDLTDYDLLCCMMSLPGCLGITVANTRPAQLHASREGKERARTYVDRWGGRFNVGIVWSGSLTNSRNRTRSAPLEYFVKLAQNPDVQLFSLLKGPLEYELQETDLSALIIETPNNDFSEAAALIEVLDLVIMTDSAIAHVAGSLGKPIWNLIEYRPYWLYGIEGETTPWYPSMRLFRQRSSGEWTEVFARVTRALAEAVELHRDGYWPPTLVEV